MDFLIIDDVDRNQIAVNINHIVAIDLCDASDMGCSSKEYAVSIVLSRHDNYMPIAFFDEYRDATQFFTQLQFALSKSLINFSLSDLIKECNGISVSSYFFED